MTEHKRKKRSAGRTARVRQRNRNLLVLLGCLCAVGLLVFLGTRLYGAIRGTDDAAQTSLETEDPLAGAPPLDVELLTVNEYSRPGISLEKVKYVAIHYTANPGSTAIDNRNYFENLKDTGETYASSHFVIGMDGEIVQCIPCNEIAYASNDRNEDTIAIECCIPDETGEFTDATYQSLIELTAWLMGRYDLTTDDVIRHYDVTGKMCPKYYVEHEDAWLLFKQDLLTYIDVNGIAKNEEIS